MSKNTLINSEVATLANVDKYTFKTAEGKDLTVTGELAKDLSVYYGMTALGNKATFETAHRIRNIMNMNAEMLNDKYGVKSGTKFVERFLGLKKGTISNYKKVADYFFNETDSDTKDGVFSVYNFAQLQELSVFIVTLVNDKAYKFDEAYAELMEVAPAEFPYTMSASKIRKAVSTYFNTVEEPETTENATETAGNATETAEEVEEPEVTENAGNNALTPETAMAILSRCKSARMTFNGDGTYAGEMADITDHFRDTLDFVINLLEIK